MQKAALAALKEELTNVLREKSDLLQQLSQLTLKVSNPTRETIEHSEFYKSLVLQIEHLSSEIARSESSNDKLREDSTKLNAERTKFKEELIAEHKAALEEANNQIQRIEKDLTRVRGVRDELH